MPGGLLPAPLALTARRAVDRGRRLPDRSTDLDPQKWVGQYSSGDRLVGVGEAQWVIDRLKSAGEERERRRAGETPILQGSGAIWSFFAEKNTP